MKDDHFWRWMLMIMVAIGAVVVGLGPLSCPRPEGARDLLDAEGFSDVTITGGAGLWACGKGDGSATGFEATGPTGARVKGVVCCGLAFKACTVRVDHVIRRAPHDHHP